MSKEGRVTECGFNPQQPPNKLLHWIFTPPRFVKTSEFKLFGNPRGYSAIDKTQG